MFVQALPEPNDENPNLNQAVKPTKKSVVKKKLRSKKSKKGQTLVEYALILAFISVVAISVLINVGKEIKEVFTTISSQLAYANSSH